MQHECFHAAKWQYTINCFELIIWSWSTNHAHLLVPLFKIKTLLNFVGLLISTKILYFGHNNVNNCVKHGHPAMVDITLANTNFKCGSKLLVFEEFSI